MFILVLQTFPQLHNCLRMVCLFRHGLVGYSYYTSLIISIPDLNSIVNCLSWIVIFSINLLTNSSSYVSICCGCSFKNFTISSTLCLSPSQASFFIITSSFCFRNRYFSSATSLQSSFHYPI